MNGDAHDRTDSELCRSFSTAARRYVDARTASQAGTFAQKAPTTIRTPWLSGDELAILERHGRMTEDEVFRAVEDRELRERVAVARAFERYCAERRQSNNRLWRIGAFTVFAVAGFIAEPYLPASLLIVSAIIGSAVAITYAVWKLKGWA